MKKLSLESLKVTSFVTKSEDIAGGKAYAELKTNNRLCKSLQYSECETCGIACTYFCAPDM